MLTCVQCTHEYHNQLDTRIRVNAESTRAFRDVALVKRAPRESEKDFAKRRNGVYSRRVHERRENEKLELEQQSEFLKLQNTNLKADNRRLQSLLAQARSLVGALESQTAPVLLKGPPKPQQLQHPAQERQNTDVIPDFHDLFHT